jgi:PAS domain S-box-containing protein
MAEVVSRSREPAEALLESEPFLAAYFNASRVGLCVLDTDLRYLAINRHLADMNGIPAEAHLGKTLREMLGDFAEVGEPPFRRVLATRQPVLNLEISSVLPTRTKPGHWIAHYFPIQDATGRVIQIGAIVVEITEQKKLEESLRGVSETLREEKKRQHAMMEVSRVLSAKWDVRHIFPKISAYLRGFFGKNMRRSFCTTKKAGSWSGRPPTSPCAKGRRSKLKWRQRRIREVRLCWSARR